jgi:hypothetical protein
MFVSLATGASHHFTIAGAKLRAAFLAQKATAAAQDEYAADPVHALRESRRNVHHTVNKQD